MVYEIYALKCAETGAPGSEVFYQTDWNTWYPLYCYLWVIKDDEETIVVDTGLRNPNEFNPLIVRSYGSFGEKAKFVADPDMNTTSLLRRVGINVKDVRFLIATHLHYDHFSNVEVFSNAEIFISEKEWLNVLAPKYRQLVPPILFPRDVFAYLVDRAWNRVHLVKSKEEILPGIRVFWTGGHTPGSQAVSVQTAKGMAIITGDVVFLYKNIERNIPIGCAINVIECLDAMKTIREEAEIILPSHDPEVLTRFPSGKIP